MKPLLWKELRENVRWLPVGLIVVSIACWIAVPDLNNPSGLLASVLLTQLAIVTPLLAFALGVVQAYRDLQAGPAAYLNHRGVTASQIFLAKTISGFVFYAVSVIVPLTVMAAWVGYEGMTRYPMRPAQLTPALVFALASFLMHPAAMLMMSRSASWWGTRLLPLVPAGAVLIPFYAALVSGGLWWAGISLVVTVPMLAWLIAISRQSWRDLATEPPASRVNPRLRGRWLLPTYLFVGVSIGYLTALGFTVNTIENYGRPRVYVQEPTQGLALDKTTGEPWLMTTLSTYDRSIQDYHINVLGGDAIKSGGTIEAMKPLDDPDRMGSFSTIASISMFGSGGDGFFTRLNDYRSSADLLTSYDERGYVLFYNQQGERGWVGTIASDGAYPPDDLSGVPFASNPLRGGSVFSLFIQAGYTELSLDAHGVYLLGTSPLSIERLIDQPIDSAGVVRVEQGHAPRLLIGSGGEIFEYEFLDGSGADTWFKEPKKEGNNNSYWNYKPLADLSISAKLVNTYEVPGPLTSSNYLQVALFNDTLFLTPLPTFGSLRGHGSELYRIPARGDYERIAFQPTPPSNRDLRKDRFSWADVFVGFAPGILGIVVVVMAFWRSIYGIGDAPTWNDFVAQPIQSTTIFVAFVIMTILAIWLTRRVAYRRGLSRWQTLAWCVSVLMLGLVAPLSLVAIYRRVHRTECSHCGQQRRVDTEICEHCGEPWQRPVQDGILILDDAA